MLDRVKAALHEKTQRFQVGVNDATELGLIRNEIEKFKGELDSILSQLEQHDQHHGGGAAAPIQMRNNMDDTVQNLLVDRVNWGCARTGFIYHRGGTNTNTTAAKSQPSHEVSSGWAVAPDSGDILTANRAELLMRLGRVRRDISRKRGEL